MATRLLNVTSLTGDPHDLHLAGMPMGWRAFPISTVFMYLGKVEIKAAESFPGQYSKVLVDGVLFLTYNPWRLEAQVEKV